jgi:hypothetical protein
MFLRGRARPVRKADNLTAICEPIFQGIWDSQHQNPYRPPRSVTGIALHFFTFFFPSSWPPLWSSGQSSLLQIRRPGFDSRHYQKKNVVGLERGQLSLVSTDWGATWLKSSGSCLENREYGRRDPSRWPRGTFNPHKLAITSPTSGGRSVGIIRSRTQTMEIFFFFFLPYLYSSPSFLLLTYFPPIFLISFLFFPDLVFVLHYFIPSFLISPHSLYFSPHNSFPSVLILSPFSFLTVIP